MKDVFVVVFSIVTAAFAYIFCFMACLFYIIDCICGWVNLRKSVPFLFSIMIVAHGCGWIRENLFKLYFVLWWLRICVYLFCIVMAVFVNINLIFQWDWLCHIWYESGISHLLFFFFFLRWVFILLLVFFDTFILLISGIFQWKKI